jgi:uncharacterized RDD family membrane protein YckC
MLRGGAAASEICETSRSLLFHGAAAAAAAVADGLLFLLSFLMSSTTSRFTETAHVFAILLPLLFSLVVTYIAYTSSSGRGGLLGKRTIQQGGDRRNWKYADDGEQDRFT